MVNVIEGFKIISEGVSFKDKWFISGYLFFRVPLHIFMRKLGAKRVNNNLRKDVLIKNHDGIFYCGKNIFSVFTCSSVYEKEVTSKIKELKEGVFLDIGSNVGRYSIALGNQLRGKGKVIAIEPIPGNVEIINNSICLNHLDNVTVIEAACGAKEEERDFYIDPTGAGGGSSSLIKSQKESVKIQVRKVDNIVKSLNIGKVDLMKIDVEGAESEVLEGSINTLKKFHPKIIFEAWDGDYFNRIKKILVPLGYKIEKIGMENYVAF